MYEHTFFTQARMKEFWEMVAGLLKLASPGVMISVGIAVVGMVLVLAIKAFRKGSESEYDDNRDYDIKYYDD